MMKREMGEEGKDYSELSFSILWSPASAKRNRDNSTASLRRLRGCVQDLVDGG